MPVYIDKLRGSWYFDIRYRDSEGRVRSIKRRGFKTEQIALNAERKFLRESRPESLPKTRLTIREIGLEMINEQKHDIKEHTFNASRHKITSFIPNVSISNITPRKALQWRNSLAELQSPIKIKKDGSTTGGKPYSTKYKNEIITLYKSIFKYALKMDYIVKDTSVDILPFKKQYEDTIPYNIVSYKAFMDAWDALPTKTMTNNFFKFFILLSFSTGARRAELKGLQFKDYDGKGIYINKSVTGKNSDRSLIEKTKTPTID
ncbi:Arm DNA-binding domain-containing protein [Erysipelothrix sp. D19-032]